MQALLLNFRHEGKKAIEKVARNQPAAYLKILALLVPREMKLDHSGGVKAMTDEELEVAIAAIKAMIAARDAGASAKVVEEVPEPIPALPAPSRKARRKARRTEGGDGRGYGQARRNRKSLNRPRPARQGRVGPRDPTTKKRDRHHVHIEEHACPGAGVSAAVGAAGRGAVMSTFKAGASRPRRASKPAQAPEPTARTCGHGGWSE